MSLGKDAVGIELDRLLPQPLGRLGKRRAAPLDVDAIMLIAELHLPYAVVTPADLGVDLAVVEILDKLLKVRAHRLKIGAPRLWRAIFSAVMRCPVRQHRCQSQ
jgi:hypothetical protein